MVNSYSCLFLFGAGKSRVIIRAHYDLTALHKTETSKTYISNFEKNQHYSLPDLDMKPHKLFHNPP
jgi:hypothetical protein